MKKIGIYIATAVLLGMATSCLDDDNNYNYTEVNELQRGGIFLDDEYSVVKGKEITLSPTFKFTIDSINPDVSYEWYLDKKLIAEETKPTYTFKAENNGIFQVTFAVIDNKTGVKFGKSTFITVRDVLQRGWTILSEEEGTHRSVLHFILPTSVKYDIVGNDGKITKRDSIVYHDVRRDINPNLGKNPKGLFNNVGHMNGSGELNITEYDELIVKQDRWEELNGNTLEHEVYTEDEFFGDLPQNFDPVEASMTYSAKVLRSSDGMLYWQHKSNIVDFHAGAYLPIPLDNGTKFKRLFPAIKMGNYMNVMLALREKDNSLVGILDRGSSNEYSSDYQEKIDISENSKYNCGNVYEIYERGSEKHFVNIKQTVVDAFCFHESWDCSYSPSVWLALLKDEATNEYQLRNFTLNGSSRGFIRCSSYFEMPLGHIANYKSIANFPNRRYVVYADGNKLYYCQYGKDEYDTYEGTPMLLGTLPGNVKKLDGLDLVKFGEKQPHAGQLGVALEDGSFYIFGVVETRNKHKVCTDVKLEKLYPNKETGEDTNHFGKIVDMKYKIGRAEDCFSYKF